VPQRAKDEAEPDVPVHLVDTNVLLRFLDGDDRPKAARASALMDRVERAEETIEITDEVATETVWTLNSFYDVPREEISRDLTALVSLAGVRLASRGVMLEALQSYASTNADFVDCLLAARSRQRKVPVYSFDETDFKKLGIDWAKP
jgi:predicted nucleic-acid-binding protein